MRFALGVAGDVTPAVLDAADAIDDPYTLRLGLRPVLDVEVLPWLAFDAYAPFTLLRVGGDVGGAASSGAESVFGIGASGRYRTVAGDVERLLYGTVRGGFSVVEGTAGPFVGLSAGAAWTWLDTGRGVFAAVDVGHVGISGRNGIKRVVDRWLVGLSLGVVFRLGGTRWDL